MTSDKEEYVIEMLFQLARIAAQDADHEMSSAIEALWVRFRGRAAQRLAAPNQYAS